MTEPHDITGVLQSLRSYLTESLLPFWIERSPDTEYGGFLTYFDRHGRATGETTKTFLMQIRMLYTLASAHRAGYGGGRCAELAQDGARFIADHYWDAEHDGWIWIADRGGTPLVRAKVGYGQCFGVYAFSEYFLATGDELGRELAHRTYDAIARHMVDTRHGGFYELMQADWQPERPGRCGGDRKSFDVHMHMMEALTTFYEMTGAPTQRRRLEEVIDLLLSRMLHPGHRLGYVQFSLDFEPLPAILFDVEWGRDAQPEDGDAHPLDMTSPGHNVEFAWLLLHAADILGRSRDVYADVLRAIADHCVDFGLDREFGGVYADVPMARPASRMEKQFWQQAEAMIGLLDAVRQFGDDRYWLAFRNVHGFVFTWLVQAEAGGEWIERVDRKGNAVDAALGHAWKISYHTVRSVIQCIRRLELLSAGQPIITQE